MLETIMPNVRLLPPARLRACRLGWYLSSSIALITRARVEVLTTLALLRTRETVAVETLARRATCSRFMFPNIVLAGRLARRNCSIAVKFILESAFRAFNADSGGHSGSGTYFVRGLLLADLTIAKCEPWACMHAALLYHSDYAARVVA